jgi:hypothetical protein
MKSYQNLNGNSGIKAYELLPDGIKIQFADDSIYLYNYEFNGQRAIKIMKALAKKGIGLTTYINQEIRENFAEKIQ